MGKKTKSNQVAETVTTAAATPKTADLTPKEPQQKHVEKTQTPKLSKQQVEKEVQEEKKQRVQVFGLYFHSQKVLSTFLFFAVGIIIAPICTYLFAFNHLEGTPDITRNQAQMYSGFISVGVVILFMIGYCVVAITDESNFKHEQREYDLLTEKEKKETSKQKLTEAFEETALEHGIKEVIRKQPKKVLEAAPAATQEAKKKTEAKTEVKKTETKTEVKKTETKAEVKKEEPKTQKKEENKTQKKEEPKVQKKEEPKTSKKEETKKEEPKKVAEKQQAATPAATTAAPATATKGKETKGKGAAKKEQPAKETKQTTATTSTTTTTTTVKTTTSTKKPVEDDDWNYVKETKKGKTSSDAEAEESPLKKDNVTTFENNDTFIVVKQSKKK